MSTDTDTGTDTKAVLRKLLSDHVGENNAVTQKQLSKATGVNPSTLRSELRRLREERQIPIANQRQGYYIIRDREELQDYVGHINEEIQSKRRTIEHTLDAFEDFDPGDVDVSDPTENDNPEVVEQTYPCAECGEEIPRDDVMYWESRPLCRTHWEEAANAK